jgi:hypothetical protein
VRDQRIQFVLTVRRGGVTVTEVTVVETCTQGCYPALIALACSSTLVFTTCGAQRQCSFAVPHDVSVGRAVTHLAPPPFRPEDRAGVYG